MDDDKIIHALQECDETLGSAIEGCSDGFCYLTGPRRGQHTNGGCRCVPDFITRKSLLALHRLRRAVREAVSD